MQTKMMIVGLFSLMMIDCDCRPKTVPMEASIEENRYFLFDSHDGTKRYRSWNQNGELDFETLGEGEDEYHKVYLNGKLLREGYSKELNSPKQRVKSKKIPVEAIWSNIMDGWEYGNFVNGRKEGVWKVWFESGIPLGFIHYRNGTLHGESRQYSEETGSLLEIKTFYNNENQGNKMFYPEEDYDQLPYDLKKILDPLSKREPLINEFFNDIPLGAATFLPKLHEDDNGKQNVR